MPDTNACWSPFFDGWNWQLLCNHNSWHNNCRHWISCLIWIIFHLHYYIKQSFNDSMFCHLTAIFLNVLEFPLAWITYHVLNGLKLRTDTFFKVQSTLDITNSNIHMKKFLMKFFITTLHISNKYEFNVHVKYNQSIPKLFKGYIVTWVWCWVLCKKMAVL